MSGPLAGLKILDFSALLPGPFATLALADLGADVIRVEAPGRPDAVRRLAPQRHGASAAHAWLNRNKRSLALDLKHPEAPEIVRQLIATHDIVVEQFRPGVMARLGLGYAQLREHNPALIYCSITGYGQDGPYRDRAGHDINYLSIAGTASYSGRDAPAPLGIQVADVAGGSLHAALSILAAVVHRDRSGAGQAIDVSMTDAAFSLNALSGAACLAGGRAPRPAAEGLNGGTFYDYYATADGRHFSVGSLEPQFLERFCEAMEHPEWLALARSDMPALKRGIAAAFASRPFAAWCEVFAGVDCCVEPVLTLEEAATHPQMQARGMVVDVPVPGTGQALRQIAHPVRYSATPAAYRHAGEPLGGQSREILSALGYDDARIDALAAAGTTTLGERQA
ncbi:CaiB/BaiF CoA transferase family protein [Cupriavidus agavae]|uniref:Crotonobetainyl-CoA:carnitine CoA-transferase CaiB-like acyl-CoA transferase n=1 Tax=Cupriavidus agavae TaxID=1001822 RepID=A0A4Q7RZF0_9BURK|nr:CaiB/BaiF CoA-transferase family protein [Cupriavidus agavae]RZT39254.1 crotonobetainyl-CoA:carnitine CoA-transferase CaiB-like acyl-CoA transferase [Cupriavidus agavae]